jgi:hypothetical protein
LLDELTNMHTSSRLCRRSPHPAFYIIRYNEITKKGVGNQALCLSPVFRLSHCLSERISNASQPTPV